MHKVWRHWCHGQIGQQYIGCSRCCWLERSSVFRWDMQHMLWTRCRRCRAVVVVDVVVVTVLPIMAWMYEFQAELVIQWWPDRTVSWNVAAIDFHVKIAAGTASATGGATRC